MQRDGGGRERYEKDGKSISVLRFTELKGQKKESGGEKKMKNKQKYVHRGRKEMYKRIT
jgi:hypothetical protein